MRAIIAGCGIGGATAARALLQEGVEVVVLEQAPELTEIGAGLQVGANGTKVLEHLGAEKPVADRAVAATGIDWFRLGDGERIYTIPLGGEAAERYGSVFYQAHRADLLAALVDGLPPGVLRLGVPVEGVVQDATGVTAQLASGETVDADILIAADGIRSSIRQQLFGHDEPRFSGLLGWRAMIPHERIAHLDLPPRCYGWFGPGRSIVTYWVRPGEVLNFIGFVPSDEVRRESWTEWGSVEELRESFAGVCDLAGELVAAIDSAFITGVFFRDPLDSWVQGRVALLGDAAHPMSPFLAQGACTAMEDGVVLARCLSAVGDDPIAALVEYERRRIPRTKKMQAYSRASEQFWHEPDPQQARARDGRFRGMEVLDPLAESISRWIYEYDPVAAAAQPAAEARGLSTAREGKRMMRDVAQRAADLWKEALSHEDWSRGWRGMRRGYSHFLDTNFPPSGTTPVQQVDVNGVRGSLLGSGDVDRPHLLHIHGGGFMLGSGPSAVELGERLAAAADADCFVVDYRLAPEHPFPAALDDCLAAYRWLLDRGVPARRVVITGESCGGGLAVSLALAARLAGLPLPAGIYAASPFADLALESPTIVARDGDDPVISRDLLIDMSSSYLQGHDPRDGLASPVHADLAGLPPMLIHAASNEALLGDAIRLVTAAQQAGIDVELELFDDSLHSFILIPFLPETTTAVDERFPTFVDKVCSKSVAPDQGGGDAIKS